MSQTSHGVARYSATRPTEPDIRFRPSRHGAEPQRGIVYSHGWGNTVESHLPRVASSLIWALCDRGHMVVVPQMGANYSQFGNDDSRLAAGDANAYVKAQGAKSGKVVGVGASMGALNTLGRLVDQPGEYSAIILLVPCIDLQWTHDNVQNAGTAIDNAYGSNAAYLAALPTHSPVNMVAAIAAAGVPIRAYTSSDDPTCPPAITAAFIASLVAAGANATVQDIGAAGHSVSTMNAGAVADALWREGLLA